MVKSRITLAVAGALLATLLVVFPAAGEGLKHARFIPQWVPQAQFAGYYVAKASGIYAKYGIDLEIITGGPGRQSADYLTSGKVDFASLWLPAAITMRSEGVPLVNIAQIMQRSALMLVAKKKSGITTPQDMNGRRVGLWDPMFQVQPRAFFKKFGISVEIVPQSYTVNLFLRDGVDVASAMWYNEYHTIINDGINPDELVTFFFNDYGLNFPEDGLYVLERTFNRDPELCKAFVRASIEGWLLAFAKPREALDIVMSNLIKANVPATRVHQQWMLARMKDLILPKDHPYPMGCLDPSDYQRVTDGLSQSQMIQEVPPFTDFYRKSIADD
ncbi:MAG: ABC transporter substrate-binding protein [Pseudomonadota bacterium]